MEQFDKGSISNFLFYIIFKHLLFFFFWSQIVFKYSYLNRTTYVTLFSFQTLKVLSKSQNKIHQLIQTYQCCKYYFAYQEKYFQSQNKIHQLIQTHQCL
jgi:hypothetical protein